MSLNYVSHLEFPSFFYPKCYFGQPETVCGMFQPQPLNPQFCNYKFILPSSVEYFVLVFTKFHLTDSRLCLQFSEVKIIMNSEPVVQSTSQDPQYAVFFILFCTNVPIMPWIVSDLQQIPVRWLVVCPQSRTFSYWFLHTECGFSSLCCTHFWVS